MNVNQTLVSSAINKDVVIGTFSILGVGGFRTVRAADASVEKRMRSAMNQIDSMLRDEWEKLDGSPNHDSGLMNYLMRGIKLIEKLKDTSKDSEAPALQWELDELRMSSEEFLHLDTNPFAGNTDHFMQHLDELELAYRTARRAARGMLYNPDIGHGGGKIPYPVLCAATGSIFGDQSFYLVLPSNEVSGITTADSVLQKVKMLCFDRIRNVKNFHLTDFLRMEDEEGRARIREKVRFLDSLIDSLDTLAVHSIGSLYSETLIKQLPKQNKEGTNKRMTETLEHESLWRVQEFVMSKVVEKFPALV